MTGTEHVTIITHTDLDGVASAAVYLRVIGRRARDPYTTITFTEPYHLTKTLRNIPRATRRIAIMDLGPNSSTINEIATILGQLARRGIVVEWYDHHRWNEDWVNKIKDTGTRLYIDTSTCSTGVVAKYASENYGVEVDEHIARLVEAVCAADLWRWGDYMAPRLFRVAERYRGRRGDAWRRMLIEGFSEGSIWWPELSEALEEYLTREFNGFNYVVKNTVVVDVDGCRIAIALKKPGPPSPSIIGNALLDRFRADVAVVVKVNGRGLSLRSRNVDVRRIAVAMGGGGHPRAAGAPLEMPLVYRLLARIYPRLKLRYAASKVVEVVSREGCRRLS